ncbi:hypothetical protein COLO4_11248 [Corchorus olitorius]|uniref:Cadmium-induced protein AS8 n=1 Tax=Corchorus olitorius TaxID=93759 RepID=A0A1R3K588_9ROSI|nr:hypothetical protein COLO4_11248 [Corchorus olitorius]
MGIGVGCGVGWGPGFGPEVIGYVGAGCGVGFSVGITLAGIGIGLPANFLFNLPYNAFLTSRTGALDLARSSGLFSSKVPPGLGWDPFASHVSALQRESTRRLSSMLMLPLHASSIREGFERFNCRFSHPPKGRTSLLGLDIFLVVCAMNLETDMSCFDMGDMDIM